MIKILFLIHDLGQGGAEKVLVNLVNNMDPFKFDIHVTALFGGGVNEQFLKPHIHYHYIWPKAIPGNSWLMKLLTPKQLHKLCVHETFDIEVSYLEGVSARIISGGVPACKHLVTWIHGEQHTHKAAAGAFRSLKEAKWCYNQFQKIVCVAETVKTDFCTLFPAISSCDVLYNTVESDRILSMAEDPAPEFSDNKIRLIAVGSLKPVKAFDRLLRITNRLIEEKYNVHLYILGRGPLEKQFHEYIKQNSLTSNITLLGYQTNPYKYVAKADLFLCSSHSEGFSTAATEALILGVPVCTVEVSGMKEMLGSNNEYGVITENSENSLYLGIKRLLDDPNLLAAYRKNAKKRGKCFDTKHTVEATEKMFERILSDK
ncbi:MAG TPA: glycosyltransferase [Candidatus Scubalenecus merdavium]|uniref:Glycosyltransferase n=1 Tax=Candidatus Scybalenecus merdavium TaxID=2840939 RepID=A0A9D1SNI3_9FIRM|nr:glycosyltransferase [Candidatus Scubalenecus merdavium]